MFFGCAIAPSFSGIVHGGDGCDDGLRIEPAHDITTHEFLPRRRSPPTSSAATRWGSCSGWIFFFHQVGSALAGTIGGWLFDQTGARR